MTPVRSSQPSFSWTSKRSLAEVIPPCGSSFLEVRLSRRSVDLREAHRQTHTHRVGIRTPLSGIVAIGTVELVRLAVSEPGAVARMSAASFSSVSI